MQYKILLIGSQHGNELLGKHFYAYLETYRPQLAKSVEYLLGNPKAYERGVRYIESDLNRSYTGGNSTYEEHRAVQILDHISKGGYNLVLDLHTTTCIQSPCLIVPSVNADTRAYVRASSIENVVELRHSLVQTSLIGSCAQAVCIEIQANTLTNNLMCTLADDLERYIKNEPGKQPKKVYEVKELLMKNEINHADADELANFRKSKHGYYPILVGNNSYKKQTNYLGFKAHSLRVVEV